MPSLKKIFRSLILASREIKLELGKLGTEKESKPKEEHVEKSKLEKQVEEYIMIPLPETMSGEDLERIRLMKIKRSRKKAIKTKEKIIKKEPLTKKIKVVKKKEPVTKKKTVEKKIKKEPKPKKKKTAKPKKPKINKAQLKKQLLIIEKKQEELRKKGFSEEQLKIINEKIQKIKKILG